MMQRLEDWKKAVKNGHNIGNHTIFLPCSINFKLSRQKALEDYSLSGMCIELDSANKTIKDLLGVIPVSFGYPFGQTYISRGTMTKSYEIGGEVEITLDVKNTVRLKGEEVVQLYIHDIIGSTSKPVKKLKGYLKVDLESGEKKTVKLKLLPEDLSLFDRDMNFVVEPGMFEVLVGSSYEDMRLKGEFEVKR